MRGSLRRALAPDRLEMAFRHLLTGTNAQYKNRFRSAFDAYALATPACFDDLRRGVANGSHQPTHATKVFLPKKGGVQRLYSLLTVEDQVLYQALAIEVAECLLPVSGPRYGRSVFGNMYQGPGSHYFYVPYVKGYRWFTRARQEALEEGFRHVATFDLTAFFDSIDHNVLAHRLVEIGLDHEFCTLLKACLGKWTACVTDPPIYQGHGIPQGPLSSGMFAEVVLSYFDEKCPSNDDGRVRYLRYVDDIELFATSEDALREELLQLDYRSKEVGLFPQSSKIDIREVTDIESELRRVVSTDIAERQKPSPDQDRLRRRLMELTANLRVRPEKRSSFAYVVAGYKYEADMACRLLDLLERQPELFAPIMQYLGSAKLLSRRVTARLIDRARRPQLYPAIPAEALRLLADAGHPSADASIRLVAQGAFDSRATDDSHDLREAAMRAMLSGQRAWGANRRRVLGERNWWVQSTIAALVRPDHATSDDAYGNFVNRLLRKSDPIALVAARMTGMHGVPIIGTRTQIPRVAQHSLKAQGLIGRLLENRTPIERAMQATLGGVVAPIDWRKVLGARYDALIPAIVDWASVYSTNPTEWIMIGNTINDHVLDVLFTQDGTIGSYELGRPGSVLHTPTSKFAQKYPEMYAAAAAVNELRAQSLPAHPVTSATQRPTRRILHKEEFGHEPCSAAAIDKSGMSSSRPFARTEGAAVASVDSS